MSILKTDLAEKLKYYFWELKRNAKEVDALIYANSIIDALAGLEAFVPKTPMHEPGSLPEAVQDYLGIRAENQIRNYPFDDTRLDDTVREKLTEEQWHALQQVVKSHRSRM